MKIQHRIILANVIAFSVLACNAQFGPRGGGMGGPPPGPNMSGSMQKIFGEHPAFSANVEMQSKGESSSDATIMPGPELVKLLEARCKPIGEMTHEFRREGFYERFPARGQIERIDIIRKRIARQAHFE